MRSAFPATRQAAGARSVRSQPFRRPSRDRADRATLGRQRRPRRPVPIEPRGPAAGNPTKPDRPALSRIRPTVFNVSDGQAGSPPPQCPPNLVWTRNRGRPGHAENRRPIGVPGTPLCRNEPPGAASRCAQWRCRAPPGSAMRSALPATRQAAGAPSAWSQPSQATHARPRRWCDAGSPGRQCVTAAQKAGDEGKVRNNSSDRDRGRIRIRGRWNQPASVHHHRRRDAGASSIAAPHVAPAFRGRWNQPASVHHHRRRDAGASTASRKAGPRVRLSGPENPRAKM